MERKKNYQVVLVKQQIGYEDTIKELKRLKSKNGELTLQEAKNLLIISSNYLHPIYNRWKILPLEDMINNSTKVDYENNIEILETVGLFDRLDIRRYRPIKMIYRPIKMCDVYQKDFQNLGIEAKKYEEFDSNEINLKIYWNLDDISDLPIDYEKLKLLTKEELQDIIDRKERDGR